MKAFKIIFLMCFAILISIKNYSSSLNQISSINIPAGGCWPVDNPDITGDYSAFLTEYKDLVIYKYHTGMDMVSKNYTPNSFDTPVKAVANGTIHNVILESNSHGLGNVVIIQHGNGKYTLYGHLHSIDSNITIGANVIQGDILGIMGNSGTVSIHLHFEYKEFGVLGNESNDCCFWGYTPDPPDGYHYYDPRLICAPQFSSTIITKTPIIITTAGVRVRTGPSTDYAIITQIPSTGQKFVAFETSEFVGTTWYRVYLPNSGGNTSGWISGEFVTLAPNEIQIEVKNTEGLGLRIRDSASGNYMWRWVREGSNCIAAKIWDGQRFVLSDTQNGWYNFDVPQNHYASTCLRDSSGYGSGWASEEFLTLVSPSESLFVTLTASPQTGSPPLNGVDLTATLSGSASGPINYTFYKNRYDSGTNITSPNDFKIENRNPDGTGGTIVNMGIASGYSGGTSFTVNDVANFDSSGTYSAKVIAERGGLQAEARVSINVNSLTETVSTPNTPVGPTSGTSSIIYSFSTNGSVSNLGHPVQYMFSWGDGSDSGWLTQGITSATHSWQSNGSFEIKAIARCISDTSVQSDWSTSSFILINLPTTGTIYVTPGDILSSSGNIGGPFNPSCKSYTINNVGGQSIDWRVDKSQNWITLSPTNGSLAANSSTTISACINSNANDLTSGSYNDIINFINTTNGQGNSTRNISLTIAQGAGILAVTPTSDFVSSGNAGGAFSPQSKTYILQNTGTASLDWAASKSVNWLALSPTIGSLAPGETTNIIASISTIANSLPAGTYNDVITLLNVANPSNSLSRSAKLAISAVVNPDIYLNSSNLFFEGVNTGATKELLFEIRNLGNAPLQINNVNKISGSNEFSILSFPSTISAGSVSYLAIRFSPISQSVGITTTFRINSNDPDEGDVDFSVYGDGIASSGDEIIWVNHDTSPAQTPFAANVSIGDVIYIFGGSSKNSYYIYNPIEKTWSTKNDIPNQGVSNGGAAVINNKIYIIGGPIDYEVLIYDPFKQSDNWEIGASLPIPVDPALGFNGMAVAAVNGKIYAIGGVDGDANAYATVFEYNPAIDSWTKKKDMPTARGYACIEVVDNLIYVIGGIKKLGYGTQSQIYNCVEVYDPASDNWIAKRSMPTSRWGAASVVFNKKIFIVGGGHRIDLTEYIGTVEEYDTISNSWKSNISSNIPRGYFGLEAIRNHFIIVGGYSSVVEDGFISNLPEIQIQSPNGGENWMSGSNQAVNWATTGVITNVDIDYSADNGNNWTKEIANLNNLGSYNWQVPNIGSTTYRVKISDSSNHDIFDVSEAEFTVSITESVTNPDIPHGSTMGKKYFSYPFSIDGAFNNMGHSIQYKFDWGDGSMSEWLPIGTIGASKGWSAGGIYNIRAKARCATHITIESAWSPILTITISDLPISISGGITWNGSPLADVIMNGLPGNPATDASGFYISSVDYNWSGTVTPTLNGYVFTPANRVYIDILSDQTSQNYTAAPGPSLQLTSPNGWEHWTLGSTKTITWNAVNYTGTVRLVLFKAGVRFGNIVANIPATNGTYTWTVGQTYDNGMAPEGSDYRLYLRSTDNTIIDPSDQRLGLIDPAQLEVTSPNGGESWELGTTQNITWNANGYAGTVRLVLFQKGTKIGQIAASLPADQGSYAWTVGATQAGVAPAGIKYSIRLMASDGSQDDFSDGPMTLTESDALIVDHQHTTLSTIPSQWLDQASREKLLVLGAQGNDAMALGLRLLGDRDARLATASNANSLGLVLNEGSWLLQGANLQLQEWQWALEKAILDSQATVVIVRPDEQALLAGKLNAESYLYVLNELSGRLPNVKLVCSTVSMEEANATLARFNRQVRESVLMNKGMLFDAADIESWRGDEQHMVNETPVRHPAYRGQGLMGEENLGRQGAAAWWLLARLCGWEGPGSSGIEVKL